MKTKRKRVLGILLTLAMILGLAPATALAAEITTGNATVTAPVGGQTPSFEAVSDEPDKYSVEVLRWIDVKDNQDIYQSYLNDPTNPYYNFKFEGGKKYRVVVEFTAVGDNTLPYKNSFTINGKTTEFTGDGLKRTCMFIAESSATIPTIANQEVPVGTSVCIPWPEGAQRFHLYEVGSETVIKSATSESSPEGMYTPAYAIATSKTYYFQVLFADGWVKSNEFTVEWTNSAHTVTVTGGMASPSSATVGTQITLTPSAAPSGLVFDKWEVVSGGVTVTDNKFTMPDTNVEIKAVYKVSIANQVVPVGTDVNIPWPEGATKFQLYEVGIDTAISSGEKSGYPGGMNIPAQSTSTSKTYYFAVLFEDGWVNSNEFTVTWTNSTHTVTVTGGTASPSSATVGTEITLTPSAAPSGLVFDKWEVVSGGVTVTDNKFTMPDTNVEIKAVYKVSIANREATVGSDVFIPWPEGATSYQRFEGSTLVGSGDKSGYPTGMYIPAQSTATTKKYRFSVKFPDGWIDSNEFTVTWKNVTTYSATVADINISLPAGYGSSAIDGLGEQRAIKITNTGTETLNIDVPTLSGTNADDFSIQSFGNSIVTAGSTNSTAYAVRPVEGLTPGTYTATISCTDTNGNLSVPVTATVTLTVTAKAGETYSATVADVTCTSKEEGYTLVDSDYITIKNTGTGALKINETCVTLTGAEKDNFTLTCGTLPTTGELAGGATTTAWRVKPEIGLAPGTHTATIQFKDLEGKVTETAAVSFTVTAKAGTIPTIANQEVSVGTDVFIPWPEGAISYQLFEGSTQVTSGDKSGYPTGMHIPAQSTAVTKTYKFKVQFSDGWIDSNEFTVTWKDAVPTEYDITVTSGKATVGGVEATKAEAGATVTLTAAAAPTGTVFDDWEVVSGDITLADAKSATTTFTMPAGAVSVQATYKTAPAVYSATVADIDITLPAGYGSNAIDALGEQRAIKITNTGTETLYIDVPALSGTNAGAFYIQSFGSNVVTAGSTNSTAYAVRPKDGLAPGTYTATISCTDTNGNLSVPVTATVTLTVGEHHFDTSTWKSDATYHWNPCTDTGCTAHGNEAVHNSDKVKDASEADFNTDGYTGDKYCSVCNRLMETGKPIPAGKYIRESKATMTPAAITNAMCANNLTFTSLDSSKYTVGLYSARVYDLTDSSLNTADGKYPLNEKFVAGHEYAIEIEFKAVSPYIYETMKGGYTSTFYVNGEAVGMSSATTLGGSPLRRIVLTAQNAGGSEDTPIAVPTANKDLVYTGSTIIGVNEGTGYTLTGNTGKNVGNYTATATLASGYKWVDGTTDPVKIEWTIAKANPKYTVPTELEGTKDNTLATVTLPANWAWANDTTVMSETGTQYFKATFTPDDTTNFNVVENIDVPVLVKGQEYNITVTDGKATVDGTEVTKAAEGTVITLNADPAPTGKVFDKWVVTGATVDDENSATTTFTMPASAVSVKAIYKDAPATKYTVTVTDGTGSGEYAEGATVTLTANAPASGKVFDKWVVESGDITLADANNATTTFTMPASEVSVKATYKDAPATTYTVTVTDGTGSGEYAEGA
ncbi:MAG: hypothetical protein ACI4CC_06585, partial [Lachnospiraceae bacterium]